MSCNVHIGEKFPDFELENHSGKQVALSTLTSPSVMDQRLAFEDGYPIVVVFNRGYFCPRDQQQLRLLVEYQKELKVNYCKLVTISADPPSIQAAFRAGLNATWPFLSDESRSLIKKIDILDETEGEYAYRALPYTFVLKPDLTIAKIYNGWFFVGRPTVEELRQDLRKVMSELSYYSYEAYNSDHVKKIRIPQQVWHKDPQQGKEKGKVVSFDLASGNGMINTNDEVEVFFNFTAIPGEGYRTIKPGQAVTFDLVKTATGLSASNVQRLK